MRLAEASKVSLELELGKVPLRAGAAVPDAFSDGEDYELLFTSSEHITEIPGLDMADISCIGKVIPFCGSLLVNTDHSPIITDKTGYEHK
jgi:thiamine monophosphate kinase